MIWCTCRWFLWIWFLWINLWCDWALASDASMRSVSTTTTHSVPRWIYSESNPYLCDEPKNPVSSKWLGLWYTVSINYECNGNAESFCTVAEFSTYGVCDGECSLFVLSANGPCPTPWMHVLQNTSMLISILWRKNSKDWLLYEHHQSWWWTTNPDYNHSNSN